VHRELQWKGWGGKKGPSTAVRTFMQLITPAENDGVQTALRDEKYLVKNGKKKKARICDKRAPKKARG